MTSLGGRCLATLAPALLLWFMGVSDWVGEFLSYRQCGSSSQAAYAWERGVLSMAS